jgi:hypothetical protein
MEVQAEVLAPTYVPRAIRCGFAMMPIRNWHGLMRTKSQLLCLAAIILLSCSTISMSAQSADIRITERSGNRVTVSLTGEIKDGDAAVLRPQLENIRENHLFPTVTLSSPGGSYLEGIRLARLFAETKTSTLVPKGARCYSACAIAFLGGQEGERYGVAPARMLQPGGKIGFHAPYLVVPTGRYAQKDVEQAYEVAVQGITELIRLTGEVFLSADALPDLLVAGKQSLYEVRYVFDANNLAIAIWSKHPPAVTLSMLQNSCLNHHSYFTHDLRDWRRGKKSADSITYREIGRANDEQSRVYKSEQKIVAAIPSRWFQGGYYWCFMRITYSKTYSKDFPPTIYCQGYKWLAQDDQLDHSLQEIAMGDKSLSESDSSCLGVGGMTSATNAQFLVPPATPIERISDVLDEYVKTERPLKPQ